MTILPTGLFWLQVAQTQLKLAWIKKKKATFGFTLLKSSGVILTSSYPKNLSGTNHFYLLSI